MYFRKSQNVMPTEPMILQYITTEDLHFVLLGSRYTDITVGIFNFVLIVSYLGPAHQMPRFSDSQVDFCLFMPLDKKNFDGFHISDFRKCCLLITIKTSAKWPSATLTT